MIHTTRDPHYRRQYLAAYVSYSYYTSYYTPSHHIIRDEFITTVRNIPYHKHKNWYCCVVLHQNMYSGMKQKAFSTFSFSFRFRFSAKLQTTCLNKNKDNDKRITAKSTIKVHHKRVHHLIVTSTLYLKMYMPRVLHFLAVAPLAAVVGHEPR